MKQIEILHADHYATYGRSGFERVRFPALVRAEVYRYPDSVHTLDTLMLVPLAELERVGYDGPATSSGSLSFGQYNHSWRDAGPFTYWNQLKASRPVGPVGLPLDPVELRATHGAPF